MISPLAIALALAFWTPINHGVNPCPATAEQPTGVQIIMYDASARQPVGDAGTAGSDINGWANYGAGCVIHLRSNDLPYKPIPIQCATIAHELGHSVFNQKHAPGIMDEHGANRPIPGVCYPLPPTCGTEDSSTWTWTRCGNHRRGVVLRDGTRRIVGPRAYCALARAHRLLASRTPRLRGDVAAMRTCSVPDPA